MFCRNCGKELSKQAVACIGCGMNPREGDKNCPACGKETKEKQIICTGCGGSLKQDTFFGSRIFLKIVLTISALIIILNVGIFVFDTDVPSLITAVWFFGACTALYFSYKKLRKNN